MIKIIITGVLFAAVYMGGMFYFATAAAESNYVESTSYVGSTSYVESVSVVQVK